MKKIIRNIFAFTLGIVFLLSGSYISYVYAQRSLCPYPSLTIPNGDGTFDTFCPSPDPNGQCWVPCPGDF